MLDGSSGVYIFCLKYQYLKFDFSENKKKKNRLLEKLSGKFTLKNSIQNILKLIDAVVSKIVTPCCSGGA